MSEEFINEVREDVFKIYEEKAPPENVYHNLGHTTEVVLAVREIAGSEGISDDDLELVLIAAWYHDVGYIIQCKGHEEISIDYAKKFLNSRNYPEERIEKVVSLIEATKMPQKPKNLLEEILCDADLHHLGTKVFEEKSELLRMELDLKGQFKVDDEEWLKHSIEFVNNQTYFTKYAKETFSVQKNINLFKLEKKLKKLRKKKKNVELKESKIEIEKEKIANKKKAEKEGGRGVETMFRNVMRTHVNFSSMADNKANIMISVNTLVITIIVSLMVGRLDTYRHLIIPTAILTITCLSALVFAVMVTRPKITSGVFTQEEIKNKKANLLFFGNFYNMDLGDFTWGMKEMMYDRDYLYGNMIKDFYYLGQVLGTKYKQLRISYTIFMYGVILSVIAYAIAFILYPQGTDIGPLIE